MSQLEVYNPSTNEIIERLNYTVMMKSIHKLNVHVQHLKNGNS